MSIVQTQTTSFKKELYEAVHNLSTNTLKIALYEGKYKEALALAKRLGDGLERQDSYRSGQYRQAVT